MGIYHNKVEASMAVVRLDRSDIRMPLAKIPIPLKKANRPAIQCTFVEAGNFVLVPHKLLRPWREEVHPPEPIRPDFENIQEVEAEDKTVGVVPISSGIARSIGQTYFKFWW